MALTYTDPTDVNISSSGNFKSAAYKADEFFKGTGNTDQTIDTGRGDDRVEAGGGNDKVEGGEGDDYVDGGNGNDYISGGYGKDLLLGGAGNDIIQFDSTDFVDVNGSAAGGPGLQGRTIQGSVYDGGTGFDLIAVRNAAGNKATDGNVSDGDSGFQRVFQFSTAGNRDIRSVEGIVVDHADDKGNTGGAADYSDLVKHSLGEINANTNTGVDPGVFVAYLGGGEDTINFGAASGWTLLSSTEGADGLTDDQVAMIKTAGRFGSDGGKIESLMDTYVFTKGGDTVTIYTDAEHVLLGGTDYHIDMFPVGA